MLARRTKVALLAGCLLHGCGVFPRDSAGSLERIQGGELRVGIADHVPWVQVGDNGIHGLEPELLERWAEQMDARVAWLPGAEAELVEALHRRELDVVAAGFHSASPYRGEVAFTQPYLEVEDRHGKTRKHVLAVTPGESALLLALDRFLASQDRTTLRQRLDQHRRAGAGP